MPPRIASKITAPPAEPSVSIRVGEDTYELIVELAEAEGCWLRSIVDRAVAEYAERARKK